MVCAPELWLPLPGLQHGDPSTGIWGAQLRPWQEQAGGFSRENRAFGGLIIESKETLSYLSALFIA